MARPLRIEFDGALYHVTSRGNARADIFHDDTDRHAFLATLGKVVQRAHWLCHAFCLMDNHYHLLLETPEGNLAQGMRQLNGIYTQAYNRRHQRSGHVFQGRYKAVVIQRDSHLLEVCRYVVLNPVRAHAVQRAEQWRWSSYRATAGMAEAPAWLTVEWVLSQFARHRATATRQYRDFVRNGVGQPSIWQAVQAQALLGKPEFAAQLREYLRGVEAGKEIPRQQRFLGRPTLATLFEGQLSRARRNTLIVRAVERHGYSQKEVADFVGLHYSTVSRLANRPTARSKT
ncbi:MAG: REP-associated tyrosine transposase [bacterium]